MSCDAKRSRALWETGNECVVIHLQTLIGLNEQAREAPPSRCGWADCQVTRHWKRTNWFSPLDMAPVYLNVQYLTETLYVVGWVGCYKPKPVSIRFLIFFQKCAHIQKQTKLYVHCLWTGDSCGQIHYVLPYICMSCHPIQMNVVSHQRLEGISFNLTYMSTWTKAWTD